MPNHDKSPLEETPKTMILGRWRVSLQSVDADDGQGAAEGPLELRVEVELDPVGGGNSIRMGSIGRGNAPVEPVYVIPTFNAPNRDFMVKVTVQDRDVFLGSREPAPNDEASTTTPWTLVRKHDSSLSVSVRLPEAGSRRRLSANVSIELKATWDEDEVPALEPRGPLERLSSVLKR
ncbi:MAG: hypothetical protein JNM72_11400 [Deltaproteobacteria bacterium]|jgi:hypothetical protein|nr:hypothetical protein [Deltaproteobacteria bacterium]